MLISRPALMEIDQALRAASGGVRLASVEIDIDPLDLVRSGHEAFGWAGFYSAPDGRTIGGLGKALSLAGTGSERFVALEEELQGLPGDVHLLAGFAFDDAGPAGVDWEGFGSAELILPEITVVRTAGQSRLTVALRPGSDGRLVLGLLSSLRAPERVVDGREVDHMVESRPTPSDWRDLVAEAITSIAAGAFEKVVLARTVLVRTPGRFEPFDLVAQLRNRYPECRVFGWQEGDSVFIGASPELLIARESEHFWLCPLAGSVGRGADAEEDRWLGDSLLGSAKDRHEHAIVVHDAIERLRPLVETIDHPAEPVLQRHANVQHLATPISGQTSARALRLATVLHPTPAVGGSPRQAAIDFIAKQEGIDRGWYSGGIGWVRPDGDGDLAVALRCALVRSDRAILYAGNGIVAGSKPAQELAETRLKLHPMLDLLTGR